MRRSWRRGKAGISPAPAPSHMSAPAQPGEALASPGWFCLSGKKCCKSQGKQAMHACMQAPVFPGFYRAKPFSRGNAFFPPAGTARRRGERASAAWEALASPGWFCLSGKKCCKSQGKQAMHACMQAPVFPAFIGRSPSAGEIHFFLRLARRGGGESAPAQLFGYIQIFSSVMYKIPAVMPK